MVEEETLPVDCILIELECLTVSSLLVYPVKFGLANSPQPCVLIS